MRRKKIFKLFQTIGCSDRCCDFTIQCIKRGKSQKIVQRLCRWKEQQKNELFVDMTRSIMNQRGIFHFNDIKKYKFLLFFQFHATSLRVSQPKNGMNFKLHMLSYNNCYFCHISTSGPFLYLAAPPPQREVQLIRNRISHHSTKSIQRVANPGVRGEPPPR